MWSLLTRNTKELVHERLLVTVIFGFSLGAYVIVVVVDSFDVVVVNKRMTLAYRDDLS
jgi:hypothetical protein